MKILYIEDDEKMAKLVCLLLKSHGYDVEHFAKGQDGLERFYQTFPAWDAVIIDLDLPDVSGRALIPEMAAQRPTMPILVFSGSSGPRFGLDNRFELYSTGASAFLWKPSGGQKLLEVLAELIQTPPTPLE
jgi:DNA-binding response OmpR family regulator